MKPSKNNMFNKVWIICLIFLLTLSVYGMTQQVKSTHAAPTLYGMYKWSVPDKIGHSAFDVKFKSGYFSDNINGEERLLAPVEEEFVGIDIHNKYVQNSEAASDKFSVGYCKDEKCNSKSSKISDVFVLSNTSDFGVRLYGKENYLIMNFGTSGAVVTGKEYGGFLGIGKKQYDADVFVNNFKASTIKVNACYRDSNGVMHWGHGSDYVGSTLIPALYKETLCEDVVPVIIKTEYGKLSCNTNYLDSINKADLLNDTVDLCYQNSDKEIMLYLKPGTHKITDLKFTLSDKPADKVHSEDWYITEYEGSDSSVYLSDEVEVSGEYDKIEVESIIRDREYTVTFMVEGEEYIKERVQEGGNATKPTDPSRSNGIFVGWYLNNKKYYFHNEVTSDITLEARFVNEINQVHFYIDVGSPVRFKAENVERGKTVDIPNPNETNYPTKDDQYVSGWQTQDGKKYDFSTPVVNKLKLYPIWADKLEVSFMVDGIIIHTEKVVKGDYVTNPGDQSKPGYNFLGWYFGAEQFAFKTTPIETSMYLYALFSEVTTLYKVTFYKEKGSSEVVSVDYVPTVAGTTSPPIIPVKAGYIFKGWVKADGTAYNFSDIVKTNLNLYGSWVKEDNKVEEDDDKTEDDGTEYQIIYNLNGGSNGPISPQKYNNKTYVSLKYPIRDGYVFTGWNTKASCSGGADYARGEEVIKKNLTLYACWEVEKSEDQCGFRSNS